MKKNDKPTPKLPSTAKRKPSPGSVLNKINRSTNKPQGTHANIDASNVVGVSNSIRTRLTNNEDIVQLFPDVELSIQILTSSILSPNDMVSNTLLYKTPELSLPNDVTSQVTTAIKAHIDKHYKIESELPVILREALFTKGAYATAVIPEASLDDILINGTSLSAESYGETIHNNTKSILSTEDVNLTITASEISVTNRQSIPSTVTVDNITAADLGLEFSDNPSYLSLESMHLEDIDRANKKALNLTTESRTGVLSTEDTTMLKRLLKNDKSNDVTVVKTNDETTRPSEGRPLIMKLPVESVIPVHVSNDPGRHLGYFILLNDKGSPVRGNQESNLQATIDDQVNANDVKSIIIKKAGDALKGIVKPDVKLANVEELYSTLVEKAIRSKLQGGKYGSIADIKDHTDIYNVLLSRALANKQTKLLFLPKELVSYIAFDYRENGTGKSLLEKSAMLFSIRSILMFSRLMASLKNSVTTTTVTATLDDNDVDPQKTMEKIMSESLKAGQSRFPIGTTNVSDLADWAQNVGYRYQFSHPSLPEMEISIDEDTKSVAEPDTDLDEKIQEQTIMSFGLTTEMVNSGFDAEFATTVVSNNVLLAKRVTQLQNQFTPMLSEYIRRILTNDESIRVKLRKIITNNLTQVKRSLKKNTPDGLEDHIEQLLTNDQDVTELVLEEYLEHVQTTLPTLDRNMDEGTKEAFENYLTALDDYLPMVLSSDALPSEMVGEFGEKADDITAMVKTILVREWMLDNNYLPKLTDIVTRDNEGKPNSDLASKYVDYVKGLTSSMLPLLKTLKRAAIKTDKKLVKIEEMNGEEEEEEAPTEDAPVDDTGDTGDDDTGDLPEEEPVEEEPTEEPVEEEK